MGRYEETIRDKRVEKEILEGAIVERKSDEKIGVMTVAGYVYEITEEKVTLLGKRGENPPPDLQESDMEFKLNPSGFTNTDVIVEITTKIELGNNVLQYSTDGTVYARLINALDEVGGVATKVVDKIDKEKPNQANVSFSHTTIDIDTEITATVTQIDNGVSGVNVKGSKWVYTQSSTPIGENEAGGFYVEKFETNTLGRNKKGDCCY